MTYTEKRLEEFDEKFGDLLDRIDKLYGGNPEEMTTLKEALQTFLSTSIAQAEQEMMKKVVEEIEKQLVFGGQDETDDDVISKNKLLTSLQDTNPK